MHYCLDTNTCIDAMKGLCPDMAESFRRCRPRDIGIPAIVHAELVLGCMKSRDAGRLRKLVEAFLAPYELLPFDRAASGHYAEIRHFLEDRGTPIGPNDLLIAATARARKLTLVTHNSAQFNRVPGLVTEDWWTQA